MSYKKSRSRPKDPPNVAIETANKLLKDGKKEGAFNVLFETISYRHRAQFDLTFEKAMQKYIDIGCDILKSCKEGFLHYRSLVQQLILSIYIYMIFVVLLSHHNHHNINKKSSTEFTKNDNSFNIKSRKNWKIRN